MCRVRLVCTLLDTCGSFFCKGKAGRRLDRFLAYFQRYLLAKPPLPLDVDFDVQVSHKYQAWDITPCPYAFSRTRLISPIHAFAML